MILERFNDLGNTCVPLYDEGKNEISEYTEDETRGWCYLVGLIKTYIDWYVWKSVLQRLTWKHNISFLIMINQALYNYKTFRQ